MDYDLCGHLNIHPHSPGQGRANPSAVADAMLDAVVDFVRKKHPKFVRTVKILIFQKNMIMEFHKSMKRREGEEVEEKGFFTKFKGFSRTCSMFVLMDSIWFGIAGRST